MRVLVFGDSIAYGYNDIEGGWPARIRKYYDTQRLKHGAAEQPSLYNLGIDADTSLDVLERVEAETSARERADNTALIIAIGVNDTLIRDGEEISNPRKFVENLHEIAAVARYYTDKMLFVGLTPVDEDRCNKPGPDGVEYYNQRILKFETALEQFCEQDGLPFVKLYDVFKQQHELHDLLPDGLHPNEMGHHLIASLVLPELHAMLTEPTIS